jgi:hypothetical protein
MIIDFLVFELFKNLKANKVRHEKNFEITTLFVRRLSFQNLSHILCSSFLFWTLYKQWGVVIQFHIKKFMHMGWANQTAQPKKKKIMHISNVLTFSTYLST